MALDFRNMKKLSIGGIELKSLAINGIQVWKSFTNQIPISIDTDGSIYNGTGYKAVSRANSSGAVVALENPSATNPVFVTGLIPLKTGDVVRMKNCYMDTNNVSLSEKYGHNAYSMKLPIHNTNKQFVQNNGWTGYAKDGTYHSNSILSNGLCTGFTVTQKFTNSGFAYMRFTLAPTGDPADAIITINEEID